MDRRNDDIYVVGVNMGYGHERPAHAIADYFGTSEIIIANDYKGIPASDRNVWESGRKFYERISRFKQVPVVGDWAFSLFDEVQRIPNFYPKRDLSGPSLQTRQFYTFYRHKKWMRHLVEKLAKNPKPFVSTFMSPAFAAEEFGYPEDIYVLCTDTDVSRAWAPLKPGKSRIQYLAPTKRVANRLEMYGVPKAHIHATGFAIPYELIGDNDKKAEASLERRLCNLDPNGYFLKNNNLSLEAILGPQVCDQISNRDSHVPRIAFAIGGAGAQSDMLTTLLKSLKNSLMTEKLHLEIIVGTHEGIYKDLKRVIAEMHMTRVFKEGKSSILFEKKRDDYFREFTKMIERIDALWTKPSELSFYAGLGLPIIMAAPIGSQEDFNREWLLQMGAGADQMDLRYTGEWLEDWIESGTLARMAWNGYTQAPMHGVKNIKKTVHGKFGSDIEVPFVY